MHFKIDFSRQYIKILFDVSTSVSNSISPNLRAHRTRRQRNIFYKSLPKKQQSTAVRKDVEILFYYHRYFYGFDHINLSFLPVSHSRNLIDFNLHTHSNLVKEKCKKKGWSDNDIHMLVKEIIEAEIGNFVLHFLL